MSRQRSNPVIDRTRHALGVLAGLFAALSLGFAGSARAQDEAPLLDEDSLVDLVAPVALYPDDLLAIVLPAATYPLQVVEAARLVREREEIAGLEPDPAWDDSVVALLNYPEALELLNDDLDWTWRLGEAVLAQQGDVLEAVEVFRDQAWLAGNLRSDDRQVVERSDEGIEIRPVDREVIYVPYYEPARVVVRSAWPVYFYHPHAYPLYYYPYPVGHHFYDDWFWGVSTAFSISWRSRFLHLHYFDHVRHPFYGRRYFGSRFVRHRRFVDHHVYRDGIRVAHREGQLYRWHPRRGHGARPGYRRHGARRDATTLRYANDRYARGRGDRVRARDGRVRRYRDGDARRAHARQSDRRARGDARRDTRAERRDSRFAAQRRNANGERRGRAEQRERRAEDRSSRQRFRSERRDTRQGSRDRAQSRRNDDRVVRRDSRAATDRGGRGRFTTGRANAGERRARTERSTDRSQRREARTERRADSRATRNDRRETRRTQQRSEQRVVQRSVQRSAPDRSAQSRRRSAEQRSASPAPQRARSAERRSSSRQRSTQRSARRDAGQRRGASSSRRGSGRSSRGGQRRSRD